MYVYRVERERDSLYRVERERDSLYRVIRCMSTNKERARGSRSRQRVALQLYACERETLSQIRSLQVSFAKEPYKKRLYSAKETCDLRDTLADSLNV